MTKKILIINNDPLPIEEFDKIAVVSTSDIGRIATLLEKELPEELKGATNAIIQQDAKQIQERQPFDF